MNAKRNDRSRSTPKPVTHAQIAALAHELWLAQGSPTGSDIDIWLEAERQLQGAPPRPVERDPIPAEPGRPDVDVALTGKIERELGDIGGEPNQRSPTALDF
jgi:hypothetical protein